MCEKKSSISSITLDWPPIVLDCLPQQNLTTSIITDPLHTHTYHCTTKPLNHCFIFPHYVLMLFQVMTDIELARRWCMIHRHSVSTPYGIFNNIYILWRGNHTYTGAGRDGFSQSVDPGCRCTGSGVVQGDSVAPYVCTLLATPVLWLVVPCCSCSPSRTLGINGCRYNIWWTQVNKHYVCTYNVKQGRYYAICQIQ